MWAEEKRSDRIWQPVSGATAHSRFLGPLLYAQSCFPTVGSVDKEAEMCVGLHAARLVGPLSPHHHAISLHFWLARRYSTPGRFAPLSLSPVRSLMWASMLARHNFSFSIIGNQGGRPVDDAAAARKRHRALRQHGRVAGQRHQHQDTGCTHDAETDR